MNLLSFKGMLILLVIPVILISGCTYAEMQEHSHQGDMRDFEISPSKLYSRIQSNENFKLLDVREDYEYEENHIKDTLLLSVNSLTQENLDKLGLKKTDDIVVYCRSGRRSETAYNTLKELGYQNVKSLGGGLVHWMEDGYPINTGSYEPPNTEAIRKGPKIEADRTEHDFGEISQFGGIVSTTFTIKNTGSENLILDYLSTSCGCTNAEIEKESLTPGEETTLTVVFDPDFHEEPLGRFSRTVFIGSNDPANQEMELKVFVDILEGV